MADDILLLLIARRICSVCLLSLWN